MSTTPSSAPSSPGLIPGTRPTASFPGDMCRFSNCRSFINSSRLFHGGAHGIPLQRHQPISSNWSARPDAQRFPDYFSLNLQLEKRFHLFGYYLALRGGFDNITGRMQSLLWSTASSTRPPAVRPSAPVRAAPSLPASGCSAGRKYGEKPIGRYNCYAERTEGRFSQARRTPNPANAYRSAI